MAASYESINYSLRPAKAIERKMLAEGLRCLSVFRDVKTYRYIGFGSTYFADFRLFHKGLALTDMISIERDAHKKARFDFNCPYDCIKLNYKEAKYALPEVILEGLPSIIWLDYDGELDGDVLADLRTAVTLLATGSMLIFSVNAHPAALRSPEQTRLGLLKEAFGGVRVPGDVQEKHLGGWGTAAVYRRIARNEIEDALFARNAPRPLGAKLSFNQVFNFQYADGAKMLTIGGVLVDDGAQNLFRASGLDRLPFYRGEIEPYEIRVPSLTYREIRHLDKALPGNTPTNTLGIPDADVEMYSQIYRYFPSFSEVDS